MKNFADLILKRKKIIIILFVIVTILCTVAQFFVSVNYKLADYLPEDAPSTKALDILKEEFDSSTSNLRIYMPNVSIAQAMQYKKDISEISGIESVYWLDDSFDVNQPLQTASQELIDAYYKDNGALYTVLLKDDASEVEVITDLRAILGQSAAIAGDAADNAASQLAVKSEVAKSMAVLAPIIIIILLLATASWLEPVLFIIVIGVAILINLGTNIIFGEISYMTQSIAPILQLAVSMDYTIFLLNSFNRNRNKEQAPEIAMKNAMSETAKTIIASGATTIIGFLALTLMEFEIGVDMGIVLAKGIAVSMLAAMILLPVITLSLLKYIDKARHKQFLPSFVNFGKAATKIRVPVLLLVLLLIIPAFTAQKSNVFTYGSTGVTSGMQIGQDTELINDLFGKSAQIVLLVPRDQWANESELNNRIQKLDNVTSVTSYASTIGVQIPAGFLAENESSQFLSDNYSRFIITADVSDEGEQAFALTEQLRDTASEFYGDEYYLCGNNINIYDIRTTVISDNTRVNLVAIIAIGIILLLTFRSLILPLILLLTIESAIWINLAIPYFTGHSMPYLAYLIVNAVQLGATIDYAILFTDHYLANRRVRPKKLALISSCFTAAPTLIIPAAILASAGFALGFVSSNHIVGEFGIILARGTFLSLGMVLLFLPALLSLFDRQIEKTTYNLYFFHDNPLQPPIEEDKKQ